MAATFTWCERNGANLGVVTTGINNLNWKAADDTTTDYNTAAGLIAAGTNSYTKWIYATFTGSYNTITNVYFTHTSGAFGTGATCKISKAMTTDSDRLQYSQPSRTASNTITPTDITTVSSSIAVWTGPLAVGTDGAGSSGKALTSDKPGDGTLYTNYIVTQLQTIVSVTPGDSNTITFTLQYDES